MLARTIFVPSRQPLSPLLGNAQPVLELGVASSADHNTATARAKVRGAASGAGLQQQWDTGHRAVEEEEVADGGGVGDGFVRGHHTRASRAPRALEDDVGACRQGSTIGVRKRRQTKTDIANISVQHVLLLT